MHVEELPQEEADKAPEKEVEPDEPADSDVVVVSDGVHLLIFYLSLWNFLSLDGMQ